MSSVALLNMYYLHWQFGSENFVQDLANALPHAGWSPRFYVAEMKGLRRVRSIPREAHVCRIPFNPEGAIRGPYRRIFSRTRLGPLSLAENLFHLSNARALIRDARDGSVSVIQSHGHYVLGGLATRKIHRLPVVCMFQSVNWTADRRLAEYLYRNVDRIVLLSEYHREELLRNYRVDPEKIRVIPLGADVSRLKGARRPDERFREEMGLRGRRVVLTIQRLDPDKRPDMILEAVPYVARRLPDVTFLVVGGGTSPESVRITQELHTRCDELGVREWVRFTGAVQRADLWKYYLVADVFAHVPPASTVAARGPPQDMVLVDAMAAGLPIVTGYSVVPGGVLGDGEYCLSPTSSDPKDLARGILRLLLDRDTAEEMSIRNRRKAEEYDILRIAEKYSQMYRELA